MPYTVISKSGWVGAPWRRRGTFAKRGQANAYAAHIWSADARVDGYHVAVKMHRRPLWQMKCDDDSITFNDGTVTWPGFIPIPDDWL